MDMMLSFMPQAPKRLHHPSLSSNYLCEMSTADLLDLGRSPKTPNRLDSQFSKVQQKLYRLRELSGSLSARSSDVCEQVYLAIDDLVKSIETAEEDILRGMDTRVGRPPGLPPTDDPPGPIPSPDDLWTLISHPPNAQVLVKLLALSDEEGVYLSDDEEYQSHVKLLLDMTKVHVCTLCVRMLERFHSSAGAIAPHHTSSLADQGVYDAIRTTLTEKVAAYAAQLDQQRGGRSAGDFDWSLRVHEVETEATYQRLYTDTQARLARLLEAKARSRGAASSAPRPSHGDAAVHDPAVLSDPRRRLSVTRSVAIWTCDLIHWMACVAPDHKVAAVKAGCIRPVVDVLRLLDPCSMFHCAQALRLLAYNDREKTIKESILQAGAIPPLVLMLRSADDKAQAQAVGCLGNLVHSNHPIKQEVLRAEALQPVIALLSSKNPDCRKEAALLVGQFAKGLSDTDDSWKVKIAQRGAIPPLVRMLQDRDASLPTVEYAAFALGRIALTADNRSGLVEAGAIRPLLDLIQPPEGPPQTHLQHNATFAIYGIADVDENLSALVREGAVLALLQARLVPGNAKDCADKTIARLHEKLRSPEKGPRLRDELYFLMKVADEASKQRLARDVVHIIPLTSLYEFYVRRGGLSILFNALQQTDAAPQDRHRHSYPGEPPRPPPLSVSNLVVSFRCLLRKAQATTATSERNRTGPAAVNRVAANLTIPRVGIKRSRSGGPRPRDSGAGSPPQSELSPGSGSAASGPNSDESPSEWGVLVDSDLPLPEGADVRFVTESGECFAHRSRLVAASEYFRAMFTGPFADASLREARIEVPHLEALACVLRFIYGAGRPDVPFEHAQSVLELANMYLLEDLVSACGERLAEGLSYETLGDLYDLARHYHCTTLAEHCAAYAVLHGEEILENWERETTGRSLPRDRGGQAEESGSVEVSPLSAPTLGGRRGGAARASRGPGLAEATDEAHEAMPHTALGGTLKLARKGQKRDKSTSEPTPATIDPARLASSSAAGPLSIRPLLHHAPSLPLTAEARLSQLLNIMIPDLYRLLAESLEEADAALARRAPEERDPPLKNVDVEPMRRVVQGHHYRMLAPDGAQIQAAAGPGAPNGMAAPGPPGPLPPPGNEVVARLPVVNMQGNIHGVLDIIHPGHMEGPAVGQGGAQVVHGGIFLQGQPGQPLRGPALGPGAMPMQGLRVVVGPGGVAVPLRPHPGHPAGAYAVPAHLEVPGIEHMDREALMEQLAWPPNVFAPGQQVQLVEGPVGLAAAAEADVRGWLAAARGGVGAGVPAAGPGPGDAAVVAGPPGGVAEGAPGARAQEDGFLEMGETEVEEGRPSRRRRID